MVFCTLAHSAPQIYRQSEKTHLTSFWCFYYNSLWAVMQSVVRTRILTRTMYAMLACCPLPAALLFWMNLMAYRMSRFASRSVVRTTQRRLSDLPVPSATVRGQWINELKRITPTPSTNRTIIILDLFLTILDYSWKSHCPNIIFFKERYKRLRSF